MLAVARADPRFKLVRLSRNFGHQIALTAGVDLATGDAVIVLDADLQDPPEVVLELAAKLARGLRRRLRRPRRPRGRDVVQARDGAVVLPRRSTGSRR